MLPFDLTRASWRHQPTRAQVSTDRVTLTTDPHTDLWQRSYYGFRSDNAPALLLDSAENFTFTLKASFSYRERYDQCGPIVYLDCDSWFKASVEHENGRIARLGSVVTNGGHSDWATSDIAPTDAMWYRLHRRGPDFLIETSADGITFAQMRIFHLQALGETSAEMGRLDPPAPPERPCRVGVYACSPGDSSFEATFSEMVFGACRWGAHRG